MITEIQAVSAAERDALTAAVRELVKRRGDSASVRTAMGSTPRTDLGLWHTLCAEIGVAALAIPTEFGGAGATFVETAAVLEVLGGSLNPVPVFGSAVLATAAVLLADDAEVSARILPDLASGQHSAALCWAGPAGWDRPGVRADAGLLSGTAHFVVDGESADLLVVLAASGDAVTLHVVDAADDGVTRTPLPTMDPTRPLSSIHFDAAAATAIAAPGDLDRRLRSLAWALLSAEQVGGAQAALDLTVDYTKSRKQFGRIIGSFQALKHRMADMYVLVETARSVSRAAVHAVVTGQPQADELARAAHVYCSDAYRAVTGDAIQLHGGIGITWEHDIQLHFKRAHGSSQLFGAPQQAVAETLAEMQTPGT